MRKLILSIFSKIIAYQRVCLYYIRVFSRKEKYIRLFHSKLALGFFLLPRAALPLPSARRCGETLPHPRRPPSCAPATAFFPNSGDLGRHHLVQLRRDSPARPRLAAATTARAPKPPSLPASPRPAPSIATGVGEERGGEAHLNPSHHRCRLCLLWAQIKEEEEEESTLVVSAGPTGTLAAAPELVKKTADAVAGAG